MWTTVPLTVCIMWHLLVLLFPYNFVRIFFSFCPLKKQKKKLTTFRCAFEKCLVLCRFDAVQYGLGCFWVWWALFLVAPFCSILGWSDTFITVKWQLNTCSRLFNSFPNGHNVCDFITLKRVFATYITLLSCTYLLCSANSHQILHQNWMKHFSPLLSHSLSCSSLLNFRLCSFFTAS